MDKYGEILAEIEHADNPRQTIETLQRIVCAICEDGVVSSIFRKMVCRLWHE